MNYLTCRSCCWTVLAGLLICVSGYAQTRPAKPSGNSVSGHVTLRGKPASGIVVVIGTGGFGPQQGPFQKATTDQDGNYRISDIPAGTYTISTIAKNYISLDSGRGKAIVLSENEVVENIDFALLPGGVVTGKVTDAEGRPVTEERVYLIAETSKTNDQIMGAIAGQTDDRGIYRIFGVMAGAYKVTIGRNERALFDSVYNGKQIYQQTYHPNVIDPAKATIIEVGERTETTNVDITVGGVEKTFSASGRIEDETGKPVPAARFGLRKLTDGRPDSSGPFINSNTQSNVNGEMRFERLIPGKYLAFTYPTPGGDSYTENVPFEIVDQDLTGLVFKTQKGTSISGIVVLEGQVDKAVLAKLSALYLQVYVTSGASGSFLAQGARINPDLSFNVGGLKDGKARFNLGSGPFGFHGFSILRVERDGIAQGQGLDVRAGEHLSGIKVVVGYGSGSVRGVVNLENGPLPPKSHLFLQVTKQGDSQGFTRPPPTIDTRGHFVIEALMPGVYDLTVTAFLQVGGQRTARQQITVTEGTVTDVSMVLDLKPPDSPRP